MKTQNKWGQKINTGVLLTAHFYLRIFLAGLTFVDMTTWSARCYLSQFLLACTALIFSILEYSMLFENSFKGQTKIQEQNSVLLLRVFKVCLWFQYGRCHGTAFFLKMHRQKAEWFLLQERLGFYLGRGRVLQQVRGRTVRWNSFIS